VNMLQNYLLQRHIENKQVVLFIEEAQGMPLDTLEEIRLLSNLETDQHKLLQIILFGQPELDENLAKKSIRQLRERITHNFDLSPLTPAEIHSYLNFRMREVGYTGPELITSRLAKNIAQYSGGLLRRINIIADKLLLSAFAESTHNLTSRHVIAAVNDSNFGEDVAGKNSNMMWWLMVPILIALALAVYNSKPLWTDGLSKLGVESTNLVEKQVVEDNKPAEIEKPVTENNEKREDTGAKVSETPVEEAIVVELTVDSEVVKTESIVNAVDSDPVTPRQNIVALADAAMQIGEVNNIQAEPVKAEIVEDIEKIDASQTANDPNENYRRWLDAKLQQSREWLSQAQRDNVSIQVLMSRKSRVRELVNYLQNEWPLNIDKTYLYEVDMKTQQIYRVFYDEFESVSKGLDEMKRLPESVKANSPYLHSVYRMQKALL
jgi:MSHA biogenesis protein MshM